MSKLRASALMGLVDSDDEEDILSSAQKPARTATTTTRPVAPVKRGVNATTTTTNNRAAEKPTQSTTRSTRSNSIAPATRKALAEKPSNATEKTEKTMAGRGRKRAAPEEAPPPPVRNRRDENNNTMKGARGRPRAAKVQKVAEVEDEEEAPETQPEPVVAKPPPARRGRKPKAKIDTPPAEREVPETQQPEPEIPETQHVDPTDVSIDEEEEQAEESESEHEPEPEPPARKRNGVSSVQRPSYRAVATSDAEPNDPSARKRVGDLTRKYQELEAKYRDLREIGVLEAERNYDKLKQQSEEKAKTASDLIAALKVQLAAQTELAKESKHLRQQLEDSQNKADELQEQLSAANNALTGSKTEIKALSTKLAAARSAETANIKVPGSAVKGGNNAAGNQRLLANAEAAVQQAQMKEDLYADLTGLIVRGVKREPDEDVYDCIQTGRNGTLHFKLAMGTDGADSFDEAQFTYLPQLDDNRDQDLIETLPDYLIEEITFPRPQAARFYSRVMKSLTERLD